MDKVSVGDVVTGVVTGIENYGIFLVFDDSNSGLVHISEISDSYVSDVFNYARIGDSIRVKIIGKDVNGHYKLSMKELSNSFNNLSKIKETSSGAVNLFNCLNGWIESSIKEIEKKNKNS